MTATTTSESKGYQSFSCENGKVLLLSLNKDVFFYLSLGLTGRGAQHLGKKERVKEVFLNREDGWIYAGFQMKDKSANSYSYKYVQLIRLGFNGEAEEEAF